MKANPGAEVVYQYFPQLSALQKHQLQALAGLYFLWNQRINVISRKDIDSIYLKHVLHSLGIARVHGFQQGDHILDVGTGGGFPGIPLAILFPGAHFHLVDSIAKKIKVVIAVAEALKLTNVSCECIRAEQVSGKYDYVVSRAVTRLANFIPLTAPKLKKNGGMFFLKGGDLQQEILETGLEIQQYLLADHFSQLFFENKKVLFLGYPEINRKLFSG